MLRKNFSKLKKKRYQYENEKYKICEELRNFEIEKIANDLKIRVVSDMLKCGDPNTLFKLPTKYYTRNTENDLEYTLLAEGAALAGNYFRNQGFKIDVQWDKENPNGKGFHRAFIWFLDDK